MMLNRLLGAAALACVALLAAAAPALADNYPIRDGTGTSQSFCSRLISAVQWPCHLMFGMNAGAPTAVAVDGSGNVAVNVQTSSLPSGASTAAAQATANTSLATIASNTSGNATAANQSAGNGKLDQLHTDLAAKSSASGVPPSTCVLTSAATCGPMVPIAGRDFNVSAWGTFVANFQLERSFDSGTTWLPITAAGTTLYQWTTAESEAASESEYGVQYRVRVTSYSSGTLNVRLSQ